MLNLQLSTHASPAGPLTITVHNGGRSAGPRSVLIVSAKDPDLAWEGVDGVPWRLRWFNGLRFNASSGAGVATTDWQWQLWPDPRSSDFVLGPHRVRVTVKVGVGPAASDDLSPVVSDRLVVPGTVNVLPSDE